MGWLADPTNYYMRPGSLFIGRNHHHPDIEFGINTERHAITIAGAGSGKGVGVIIPNLQRWTHNALVIDPKGEAANATWQDREELGQEVHVLDPFNVADEVPERLKSRVNILDEIDADSSTIREDINVVTDGLVMRHDPKAAFWDEGGKTLLAGLIALIVDQAPAEARNLPEIRELLLELGNDPETIIDQMASNKSCGKLPAAAAQRLCTGGNEVKSFLQVADSNTGWLDSPRMQETLSESTFQLSDLKTKPCTVYLVLPPQYLGEHGRFLRLFVRMALNAMAKGGLNGQKCLFLLDEFFALGHIDEIEKAAGLMRGYGVQLWPILQDIGQLIRLYGNEGAHTFFANADLHQFFGNTDQPTLQYVSSLTGETTIEEIGPSPSVPVAPVQRTPGPNMLGAMASKSRENSIKYTGAALGTIIERSSAAMAAAEQARYQEDQANYQEEMNAFQQRMSKVGKPRVPPEKMAEILAKSSGVVATNMFCLLHGKNRIFFEPAPYFQFLSQRQEKEKDDADKQAFLKRVETMLDDLRNRFPRSNGANMNLQELADFHNETIDLMVSSKETKSRFKLFKKSKNSKDIAKERWTYLTRLKS